MALPNNPTTKALLQHIPQTYLEHFCERGGDLEKLWQTFESIPSLKKIEITNDWMLDIIATRGQDFRQWSDEFWQRDPYYPSWVATNEEPFSAVVHYLTIMGNTEFFPWLLQNKPELLKENNLKKIVHDAAKIGNLEILQWLYDFHPAIIGRITWYGENIAHTAARAGQAKVLDFILAKAPHLLLARVKFIYDCFEPEDEPKFPENLSHFAAWGGDPTTIAWVYKFNPNLFDEKLMLGNQTVDGKNDVGNAAHCAAASGNPAALDWFLANKPELLKIPTVQNKNIAHFAADSGKAEALAWVMNYDPELANKITATECSILDYALLSNSKEILYYLLFEYPELSKQFIDKGISQSARSNSIMFSDQLNNHFTVRDEILLNITQEIMQRPATEKETKFLQVFKEDWERVLVTSNNYSTQDLMQNKNNFTLEQQKIISKVMPTFALKDINLEGQELTREKFKQILELANSLYPVATSNFFFRTQQSAFLKELNLFNRKLRDDTLIPEQILCLKVILSDYEKNLLWPKSDMLDLLSLKLYQANNLKKPAPRPKNPTHDEISDILMNSSSLSENDKIKEYIEKEYLPYTQIMQGATAEAAKLIEPACKFIMTRHARDLLGHEPSTSQVTYQVFKVIKSLKNNLHFVYAETMPEATADVTSDVEDEAAEAVSPGLG